MWMRGLGWGAASGLMVPLTFVVIAVVFWDVSVLMIGLFTGIVAFLTGVFGGGVVASLGWRALLRGVRPVGVLVGGSLFVALLIPVTIMAVGTIMSVGQPTWDFIRYGLAYLGLVCIPSLFLAVFGMWFTLRGLVRCTAQRPVAPSSEEETSIAPYEEPSGRVV